MTAMATRTLLLLLSTLGVRGLRFPLRASLLRFEEGSRRATDSVKWNRYRDPDVLPMWVADMDVRSPACVLEALQRRVEHGVFGYTTPQPGVREAVVRYLAEQHAWEVDEEALVFLPGVLQGLTTCTLAFSAEGEAVATPTPVYPPILANPRIHRRTPLALPLVPPERAGGDWTFNFDAMRRQLRTSEAKPRLLILCNPQNPTSRVMTEAELREVGAIAEEFDLTICSDEIHCDLVLDEGQRHVPIATLSPELLRRTVTLMAPSKTFNVPGLGCAFAVIPDPELRRSFRRAARGIVTQMPALGYAGLEAAYREGEPWRQDLLVHLRKNRRLIQEHFAKHGKTGYRLTSNLDVTYLAWIDVTELNLRDPAAYLESKGVGLTGDVGFSLRDSRRYVRLNFGCSTEMLNKALDRLAKAAEERRKELGLEDPVGVAE